MTQAPPVLVQNLSFRYRSRPEQYALHDVSFSVAPGEVLLIAGASGCGKTTLMRCINGLIPRSYRGELNGSVQVFGREVHEYSLAHLAQTVGTVLQDPEKQILGSSVLAELAFGPENLGLSRTEIRARVDEAVDRLGIRYLAGRDTFNLSGGEKQKVALAGALAMRPSILLLDEPLASLDPASAQESLAVFRQLADAGTSVLLIEHRVEDALAVRPDRVMYMSAGQVKYLGPAEGLRDVVEPREVKLPTRDVIAAIKRSGRVPAPISPDRRPSTASQGPVTDVQPLVEFQAVSFGYADGPEVLHDISLAIYPGEIIALLGPNAAGKSTLVKHAIGLLKPRRGRVRVGGKDTREATVAELAQTLGYVFQSPGSMLFAPSVNEELRFGPENLRLPKAVIDANVTSAVQTLNLSGLESVPPLALSFGQQKRVTIGAVVAMQSRILVMDEPTAGQDYGNYLNFMDNICGQLLRAAGSDDGRTAGPYRFDAIVFISHDLDLALTYASRVLLMRAGIIAADGPPEVALRDLERLRRCRVVPTSLLEMNLALLPKTGRFLPVEQLAAYS